MNKPFCLAVTLLLFLTPRVWAHPEPGFGIVDAEIEGKAQIDRLVEENALPKTWRMAFSDLDQSGMQVINGKKRWVMVYENPEEKDKSKMFIKIIMTPLGKFVAYEFEGG